MTETLGYAPTPERIPKPRIARDRTAVVVALVAVVPLLLQMPSQWILGRVNGRSDILPFMCLFPLVYMVAGMILLVRVAWLFRRGMMWQRVRWLLLLGLLGLPPLAVHGMASVGSWRTGYLGGFERWTRANIDARSIRQWSVSVPIKPAEQIDGLEGCTLPSQFVRAQIARIPAADWAPSIVRAKPEQVHILADRSATVLAWPAGHASWARIVVIAASEDSRCRDSYILDLGKGVWICARGPT